LEALPEVTNEITNTLGGMPTGNLALVVVLAGFGLAAWAIYVVHQTSKPKGKR